MAAESADAGCRLDGFRAVHVKKVEPHGGSIRVYAAVSDGVAEQPSVEALRAEERERGFADGSWIDGFQQGIRRARRDLQELLARLKSEGVRIYAVGAPPRATTLVAYAGLTDGIIDCVVEISGSPKIGRYLPGTLIPVVDEQRLFEDQPEYALFLSWHLAHDVAPKLRAKGFRGQFVAPLPEVRVLEDA